MQRDVAAADDQSVRRYLEQYLAERRSDVSAGQLSAARYAHVRSHLFEFRDWLGAETNVGSISGKVLTD